MLSPRKFNRVHLVSNHFFECYGPSWNPFLHTLRSRYARIRTRSLLPSGTPPLQVHRMRLRSDASLNRVPVCCEEVGLDPLRLISKRVKRVRDVLKDTEKRYRNGIKHTITTITLISYSPSDFCSAPPGNASHRLLFIPYASSRYHPTSSKKLFRVGHKVSVELCASLPSGESGGSRRVEELQPPWVNE